MQDPPSNLTDNPISATTAIAIIAQMPQELAQTAKTTLATTATTETALNDPFLHSYRYLKS
jgi:hypothetical protein